MAEHVRRPPGTVVFDLGNVLIRWDPHLAIAAGVGPSQASQFLAADDFAFGEWNHEQDAGRTWEEAESTAAATHPHWRDHIAAYRANFAQSIEHQVDDTVQILRELHRRDVPLFALTNWSRELFPVARERHGFLSLFMDIVVSGDEHVSKPAPAIFEILQRRVDRPLSECVFIDDSPANVEAAEAAGMDAILFTDTGHLRGDLVARGLLPDS